MVLLVAKRRLVAEKIAQIVRANEETVRRCYFAPPPLGQLLEPAWTMADTHWESYPAGGARLRELNRRRRLWYTPVLPAGVDGGFVPGGTTGKGRYA